MGAATQEVEATDRNDVTLKANGCYLAGPHAGC
jgi:hypothetical protein